MYAETPLRFTGFYLVKYLREQFENANICIIPTFQETVEAALSQVFQSLLWQHLSI